MPKAIQHNQRVGKEHQKKREEQTLEVSSASLEYISWSKYKKIEFKLVVIALTNMIGLV